MQMLMNAQIPVVEIWDVTGRSVKNHAVGFSNFQVGQAMTRHLIDRGYRIIGSIGPPNHDGFVDFRSEERMAGYLAAMEAAGFATDLITHTGDGPVNISHGAAGLTKILEEHPDLDAIFAVSDLAAVGTLLECQSRLAKTGQGRSMNQPASVFHVERLGGLGLGMPAFAQSKSNRSGMAMPAAM